MLTAQKYIWLDQAIHGQSSLYNIGGYVIITGALDTSVFRDAVNHYVRIQEVYGLSFREQNGMLQTSQNVHHEALIILDYEKQGMDLALQWVNEDFRVPFSLDRFPLYHFVLLCCGDDKYIWYAKSHHIISDGMSFQLMFNQVSILYKALLNGSPLPASPPPFNLVVEEEEVYRNSAAFETDRLYWKQKFSIPVNYSFPQKKIQQAQRVSHNFTVGDEVFKRLSAFAVKQGVSMFAVFSAIIGIYLMRCRRNTDFSVGFPVMNRSKRFKDVAGLFINVLAMRIQAGGDYTVNELLQQIKLESMSCLRHQRFLQSDMLREAPARPAYNRFYDIRLSYELFDYDQLSGAADNWQVIPLSNGMEDDPVSLHVMEERGQRINVRIDFNPAFIADNEAKELTASLKWMTSVIAEHGDTRLSVLPVASPETLQRVQQYAQGPVQNRTDRGSVVRDWRKAVSAYPDNIAITCEGVHLTFGETERKIKDLAGVLRGNNIRKGDRVAVLLERGPDIVIAMLAILQCGGVVVMLDSEYPYKRLRYMADNSQCRFCITDSDGSLFENPIIIIDPAIHTEADAGRVEEDGLPDGNDPAYIIYTSGSTGRPKGVVISHASMYDYVHTFTGWFGITAGDCVLQQSSFCFDTSVEETFPVLLAGGRLVIAKANKDISLLFEELLQEHITVLSTNPGVIRFLNDNRTVAQSCQLRLLISGGDVLKPEYITHLRGRFDIYNTYGPTESTVCATYHKITADDKQQIPIGRPITNRTVYILDDYGNLQIPGAPGEICIGGAGLALEYLALTEETAKAFAEKEACGEKIYQTGDLGSWQEDGTILFAGRKDLQLSINGYRIEPGEIEQCINAINGVRDSLVIAAEKNGHTILAAYIATHDGAKPELETVRSAIADKLPSSMMPSAFIFMDEIPILPNGKTDFSKLPPPGNDEEMLRYEAPVTPLEKELAELWMRLLNRSVVGRNNDFFELGGHSLLANQIVSIIREEYKTELSLRTFYRNPTIQKLATVIDAALRSGSELIHITPAPADADIPLSFAQERLWFLNQLDEGNTAYNVPRALKMTGVLRMDVLENVFTKLVDRHTILRTVFRMKDGSPVQVVLPPYHFHIPLIDLKGLAEEEQMARVKEFIAKEGNQRFDLANGPLLKITILSLDETSNILVLCEHHLIHDGWTQGVLLNEFIQLYSAELTGAAFPFEPLAIQYSDFAYWMKQHYSGDNLKESVGYWVKQLAGLEPALNLPVYHPRPVVNTGKGDMEVLHIPGGDYYQLMDFCTAQNVTPFMTMLAVFKLVLHKFSRDTDICVGTGVANRRIKELNNMLGMVINTIALRTQIDTDATFTGLVNNVKRVCLEGYENEDVPFGEVVNAVNPVRSLSVHPVVQYMFSFMNTPTRHIDLPGMNVEIMESYNHSAKFDICIVVVVPVEDPYRTERMPQNPEIIIEWEYNSSVFEKTTMQSMVAAYARTLRDVLADPDRPINEMDLLTTEEKQKLFSWSFQSCNPDGSLQMPFNDSTLSALFEAQVHQTPGNIAVHNGEKTFTYEEINTKANQLCYFLQENFSATKGSTVAVQLEKTEWQIISILAAVKAGAAYVPLSSGYPPERTAFILEDCACVALINEELILQFKTVADQYKVNNPATTITADDLAYIIYTSGSTGLPKGVLVHHGAVVNMVRAQVKEFGIDARENILQLSAITFDASVEQLFIALTSGASITLADNDTITNPGAIDTLIEEKGITHIHTVPGLLKTLRVKKYPTLKRVIAGGDRCPVSLADDWSGVHIFYNEYGPTETTVTSIEYRYQPGSAVNNSVPVGKPLTNTRVYILDEKNNMVPEGVTGEICIGGAGLAKGYLNRPELTEQKFVQDPFISGEKMYRTGDAGRWLPDGTIEFIGRKDDQVKIRGFRIEPGEVEHAILQIAGTKSAAVVALTGSDGEPELVAYFVAEKETDSNHLRMSLAKFLPSYMIPAQFVQLEAMPMTNSGKTDKKKLPAPGGLTVKTGDECVAPRTETEKKLVPIWQEVLGREQISVTDNFFNLGGHSLKVTKVIARIQDRFGVKPDIKEFFGEPTIEYLAEYLDTVAWIDGTSKTSQEDPEEVVI